MESTTDMTKQVLVVDDDVVSRMVLMHMIDACGDFDIVEAEDGADAWARLEQGLRPAILFCDLRMPRLSGMELLARVKGDAALAALPFVLVSSAGESATVEEALGLGAAGYVIKPFDAPQVRTHMAAFIPAPSAAAAPGLAAEGPRATMVRLGINGERLIVYLGGLHAQILSAGPEIAALLEQGRHADARLRVERVQAGCVTLGLTGAAALLDLPGTLDAPALRAAMDEAAAATTAQADAVRRMQAATQ